MVPHRGVDSRKFVISQYFCSHSLSVKVAAAPSFLTINICVDVPDLASRAETRAEEDAQDRGDRHGRGGPARL